MSADEILGSLKSFILMLHVVKISGCNSEELSMKLKLVSASVKKSYKTKALKCYNYIFFKDWDLLFYLIENPEWAFWNCNSLFMSSLVLFLCKMLFYFWKIYGAWFCLCIFKTFYMSSGHINNILNCRTCCCKSSVKYYLDNE